VAVNPDFTTLRTVGRITDQTLMQIDAQIGYWLYRAEDSSRGPQRAQQQKGQTEDQQLQQHRGNHLE